jgi:hypothetical protein
MGTRRYSSTAAGPVRSSQTYGDDVHVVGSLAPLVEGYIGCIMIKPDGSRELVRAV